MHEASTGHGDHSDQDDTYEDSHEPVAAEAESSTATDEAPDIGAAVSSSALRAIFVSDFLLFFVACARTSGENAKAQGVEAEGVSHQENCARIINDRQTEHMHMHAQPSR